MTKHHSQPVGGYHPKHVGSHVFLVILCVYFLIPLWWVLVAATKSNRDLFVSSSGALWFGQNFSLFDNITQLTTYQDGIYWRWLGNSLLYALLGGGGATIISVLAGYGFAKYQFKGRGFVFMLVLGAVMVPGTALVVPLFVMFNQVSLLNTMWSVVLPSLLSPVGTYLIRVYCQDALPDELTDAARVDGAGELRTFWSVALPQLRPAVITVLLLSVVATWNNFFLPSVMLANSKLWPITVGLNTWLINTRVSSGADQVWNLVVTGAFVSVVPLVIVFLLLQKYWQSGLTLGALK
ncbi:MAG: carbohydrate ABC transporter permease [Propionibacteriaceae bacterium]|jgi:multiple sugar transport system permease protein|nr:carbohydrate ABC transporter permease [Propionibacteriaceae bacterium]